MGRRKDWLLNQPIGSRVCLSVDVRQTADTGLLPRPPLASLPAFLPHTAPTDLFAVLPPTSEHQPEFLPSDDEAPVAPRATTSSSKKLSKQVPPLPYAPSHLPALPPRHAYLSTQPPPPPPRPKDAPAEIPLLEERYAQTRTVEGALVRLIDKTTHAGAPGSLEEGLRDLGLGLVGWRTKERAGLGGASGKRSRGGR